MSDDLLDEWDRQIGSYISTYAESERLVYCLYRLLDQDAVSKHGASLRDSADRIRFLQALLRSTALAHKKDLESVLETLIDLGKTRNQVAHNPVFLDIYLSENGENHSIEPFIHSSRKDKRIDHITLETLQSKKIDLSESCEKLSKYIRDVIDADTGERKIT